ncbi:hypothetical protein [Haloparvum sp. AD34]
MSPVRSRRALLQAAGSTIGSSALAGCLFGAGSEQDPGSLAITNDHSEDHAVTVTVTKTSEDQDDTRPRDETPAPETTPVWEREDRFQVESGERVTERDFLSETGAFYLEARLEDGTHDSVWVGLYKSAGGGVAVDAISVYIEDDGRLQVHASHGD